MRLRVLLALNDGDGRARFERLFGGCDVLPARTEDPWSGIPSEDVDLIVASRTLLSADPAATLAGAARLPEPPEVIVLCEREDAEDRARLLAAGSVAVLNRNLPDESLASTLRTLLGRVRRNRQSRVLERGRAPRERGFDSVVSQSPAMRDFVETARRTAGAASSLLIMGETGVGKEHVAKAIHFEGPRAGGPFVAINCGGIAESLLESELFGHERGAFTGATRAHRGQFELADGGTLFLDEVAELPLHLQVKLLRILEERTLLRVGGERPRPIDVRLMAATNRDLESEVAGGRFRKDLYYRLAVVTLTLPPLRERREDIPELARRYLEEFRAQLNPPIRGFGPDVLGVLRRYPWPGNVRELKNAMERAALFGNGDEVRLADLPRSITLWLEADAEAPIEDPAALRPPPGVMLDQPLRDARRRAVVEVERRYLSGILTLTNGRIGEAARRAGLDARSLHGLMKRHGLRKEAFKPASKRGDPRAGVDERAE
jgi:DNA-binding NtrC family response regulator